MKVDNGGDLDKKAKLDAVWRSIEAKTTKPNRQPSAKVSVAEVPEKALDDDTKKQMDAIWKQIELEAESRVSQRERTRRGKETLQLAEDIEKREAAERAQRVVADEKANKVKKRRRHKQFLLAGLIVTFLLVVCGIGAFFYWRSQDSYRASIELGATLNNDGSTTVQDLFNAMTIVNQALSSQNGNEDTPIEKQVDDLGQYITSINQLISKLDDYQKYDFANQASDQLDDLIAQYKDATQLLGDFRRYYQDRVSVQNRIDELNSYGGKYHQLINEQLAKCRELIEQISGVYDANNYQSDNMKKAIESLDGYYRAFEEFINNVKDSGNIDATIIMEQSGLVNESLTKAADDLEKSYDNIANLTNQLKKR